MLILIIIMLSGLLTYLMRAIDIIIMGNEQGIHLSIIDGLHVLFIMTSNVVTMRKAMRVMGIMPVRRRDYHQSPGGFTGVYSVLIVVN